MSNPTRKRALTITVTIALTLAWIIYALHATAKSPGMGGFTRLHQAAVDGSMARTTFWLLFGADVNKQGDSGQTPLHLALTADVARILLEHGADVHAHTKAGDTPLHMAVQFGQWEIVRELIKHGAPVNAQNDTGETPLHLACQKDHKIIVATLLSDGKADPTLRDIFDRTPLQHAQMLKSKDAIHVLQRFNVTR